MASYVVITSYRTVQVMSQTTVLEAEYVVCATVPHNIGFAYAVPYTSWVAGVGEGLLDVIAVELESLASGNHVVAGQAVQEIDANGLLYDAIDLVVEVDRSAQGLPPLDGTVTMPVQAFFNQSTGIGGFVVPGTTSPAEYVAAEYARLTALAAA